MNYSQTEHGWQPPRVLFLPPGRDYCDDPGMAPVAERLLATPLLKIDDLDIRPWSTSEVIPGQPIPSRTRDGICSRIHTASGQILGVAGPLSERANCPQVQRCPPSCRNKKRIWDPAKHNIRILQRVQLQLQQSNGVAASMPTVHLFRRGAYDGVGNAVFGEMLTELHPIKILQLGCLRLVTRQFV